VTNLFQRKIAIDALIGSLLGGIAAALVLLGLAAGASFAGELLGGATLGVTDLVILGLMGAAGLPERGEARIYFGADVDADPRRFDELMRLPREHGLEGALRRRDASVAAYQRLMQVWRDDRDAYFAELRRFFGVHCHAMAAVRDALLEEVRHGPLAWAEETARRIRELPAPTCDARPIELNRRGSDAEPALGMCGTLRPIVSLQRLGF